MLLSPRLASVGAAAATVAATLVSAAPSALAADPTTPFELHDGDTHVVGTLYWYKRSLGGAYSLTTRSCTRLIVSAYDSAGGKHGPVSTSLICGNKSGTFTLSVNAPGGPVSADICLDSGVCGHYSRP